MEQIPFSTKNLETNEDWSVQKENKRINTEHSPSPEQVYSRKQARINKYLLSRPTKTRNRYEVLEENETPNASESTTTQFKPPPISLAGVETISTLIALLNVTDKDNYILKKRHNN